MENKEFTFIHKCNTDGIEDDYGTDNYLEVSFNYGGHISVVIAQFRQFLLGVGFADSVIEQYLGGDDGTL